MISSKAAVNNLTPLAEELALRATPQEEGAAAKVLAQSLKNVFAFESVFARPRQIGLEGRVSPQGGLHTFPGRPRKLPSHSQASGDFRCNVRMFSVVWHLSRGI